MIPGIIGKKLGMTQVFSDQGAALPVTIISAGQGMVTQVKTAASDGYDAVQLGFGDTTKPGKKQQPKYRREFRVDSAEAIAIGDKVDISLFQPGDLVDVTGISKGKGFAGTVKRYHFRGGPKTHGQSDRHRAPGSIGSTTTPGRVLKGKHMAGHMGSQRVTVRGLEVVQTDTERNLLLVKGAVPGNSNGLLLIKKSAKKK